MKTKKTKSPGSRRDYSGNGKKNGRSAANGKQWSDVSELHQKILDNIPVSVITIDRKGYITSANRYFKNFAKTADYRGHNIFKSEFFKREKLTADYKRLLTEGTVVQRVKCFEKNSRGEDKYLRIVAVPLRDKAGKIEGALSMAMDDTEAVLYKSKLEELNCELERRVEQRTAELRQSNQELAKVLELKSRFMADLSHELRTSLTVIQGNLELLGRDPGMKTAGDERSGHIFKEVKYLSAILTDLTTLANADARGEKLNYDKVDLNRLLSSAAESLEVLAREKNVKIAHGRNGAKIEIKADESKLQRLILNLVENAIKYNKKDGWVNIRADRAGKEARIEVEDGGIGIAEEHLPFIFERFYRVEKSRSRKDGGSGLGLAICKWVAESHGGRIEVASQLGEGTRFTVSLPRSNGKN